MPDQVVSVNQVSQAYAISRHHLLLRAQQAFLRVLDGCSLDELLTQRAELVTLLGDSLSAQM